MISSSRALASTLLIAGLFLAGCTASTDSANAMPTADLKVVPGTDGRTFTLDGSASKDPDGDALTYAFDWGLGTTTGPNQTVIVEFAPNAVTGNSSFIVTLVVRDPDGMNAAAFGQINFGDAQNDPPMAMPKPATRWVAPGRGVLIDASLSMDGDGDPLSYEWIWGPRNGYNLPPQGVADACAETSPVLEVFTTGCLAQSQQFSFVFDKAGTYNYHCHPHPWMKGRLVVDPTLQGGPKEMTIKIQDFNYHNETLYVSQGTNVTFVNLDLAAHTATVEDYTPGTLSGGNTPYFAQNITEGEYIARLIVTDGRGGRTSQTFGLKASEDAPANPNVTEFEYAAPGDDPMAPKPPLAQSQFNQDAQLTFPFETLLEVSLVHSGKDISEGQLTVGRLDPDGTFVPASACKPARGTGLDYPSNEVQTLCTVKAATYALRVTAESGVLTDWTIVATAIPYSMPGFGDSAAGDGHDHVH